MNINHNKLKEIKDYLRKTTNNKVIFSKEKNFNLNDEELNQVLNLKEVKFEVIEELNLENNSLTNKSSSIISDFIRSAKNLKILN